MERPEHDHTIRIMHADDEVASEDARRSPTIYDVAIAAGVASSTVSRAFSRPGRVRAETAARIHEVARELGYRTNPLARALPTGRTALLALVVSDLTNPFFFKIIRGAEKAAFEAGYTLLVTDVQESAESERRALDRVLPLVEGLVLGTSRMSDTAIRMVAKQRPTVVLNRVLSDVPSIVTDNARGMRTVVEHLHGLDHKILTYIAGPEASWADGTRWRAMREVASELGLRARRIGPFAPTIAGGRAAAHVFAQQRTTAAVAFNDLIAIGMMHEIIRMGGQVPRDVSIVGFDDIFGADFCVPPLTTVASPLTDLGWHAVRMLTDRLKAGAPAAAAEARARRVRPALLPASLEVRDSTRERRARRPALWKSDKDRLDSLAG